MVLVKMTLEMLHLLIHQEKMSYILRLHLRLHPKKNLHHHRLLLLKNLLDLDQILVMYKFLML
jgi:hypothetical protein